MAQKEHGSFTYEEPVVNKPVKGIRKVVATRMAESVHTTAQLL